MKKILKRADTLEAKYQIKHMHDLDLFKKDVGIHDDQVEDKIHMTAWKLVKSFSWQFWLFCLISLFSYSTFGPFFANISILLRDGHNFTLIESGTVMALPSLIVCVCFPLLGYASDKINRRGTLLAIAATISCAT